MDVFAPADDSFLDLMGIEKGIMQLVERERGEILYASMRGPRQVPGGSVANTVAGLGNLGLRTAFIGRVNDDALGRFYAGLAGRGGLDFPNPPVRGGGLPTSRSMIFVSPDGERSMNTYLGISSELVARRRARRRGGPRRHPVPRGLPLRQAQRQAAFETAARLTHQGGGQAGIALSDPFCVDRHRADFRRLVRDLDYVIGNQHEWESLYQTDLDSALAQAARDCGLVVCTRSGEDVILIRGEETRHRPRPAASSPWTRPARATSSPRASSTASRRAGARRRGPHGLRRRSRGHLPCRRAPRGRPPRALPRAGLI